MRRRIGLAVLAVAALTLAGCPSVYTHINKVDDNTYYLTRIKAGRSALFVCNPIGDTAAFRCAAVGVPE